uniref:Beta-lactamase-like protein str6 n=1 Tax=Strobilurus tenacellus TaxID=41251 RepID=STR6_STRTC|nr:RecName: Full=Beta-lactamase-like protein str6; AltName: Full=Strobilurin A biosynthesis cluster protein r6 [Strobilurus tenacellus]ATV82116.1 hydrolase 2 [Strobilurus tenacellus]
MIPNRWRDLARRDIFEPLGLNGSYFIPNAHNRAHVAVASKYSDEVDIDFLDVMACSGGQMSSLSDYIKLMQTFLDPTLPQSLLPAHIMREWMTPVFGFNDDETEVGLLWEIVKIQDSYCRPVRVYEKNGVLGASRSVFAIHREMAFGVALLNTGTATVTGNIALEIFRIMQPYLDKLQERKVKERFAGHWRLPLQTNATSGSMVDISVSDGSLWITRLVLNGTDVLSLTEAMPAFGGARSRRVALWSMRRDEFRMVLGAGAATSCMSSWTAMDSGFSRGYPMDLVYFKGGRLHIPSAGVVLVRA